MVPSLARPCLCGGKIVVGTEAGTVYFIDPTGKILQTISLSTTMKVMPHLLPPGP